MPYSCSNYPLIKRCITDPSTLPNVEDTLQPIDYLPLKLSSLSAIQEIEMYIIQNPADNIPTVVRVYGFLWRGGTTLKIPIEGSVMNGLPITLKIKHTTTGELVDIPMPYDKDLHYLVLLRNTLPFFDVGFTEGARTSAFNINLAFIRNKQIIEELAYKVSLLCTA